MACKSQTLVARYEARRLIHALTSYRGDISLHVFEAIESTLLSDAKLVLLGWTTSEYDACISS